MTLTSGLPWYDRVEDELAADRRDPDAVAVAADPADDAVDEVPRPRVGRVAEPERVEDGDRPGAHREDVAEDAADAGRGALVRLDRARMVVRLDLERDRQAVADRDDPGVLARPGDDAGARGRQRPEERLRALVRAVLAPHHAEHRQLELVRVAAEPGPDRVELVVGEPEPAVERLLARPPPADDRLAATGASSAAADRDRAAGAARAAALSTSERMIPSPSSEPRTASTAVSGWGIRPATLPAAFVTPAIARSEPFGFARSSSPPATCRRRGRSGRGRRRLASSASSVAGSAK